MKAFNIRTVVLALFFGGLLLTSCEDESTAYNPNSNSTPESHKAKTSSTVNNNVSPSSNDQAVLDSIKNDIKCIKKQVGEIGGSMGKYKTDINNLKDKESDIKLLLLISLAFSIVLSVIALVALIKAAKFNKRLDKHGNDIYNLKQSSDCCITSLPRQNGSDDYYQLKSRLKILEEDIRALIRTKNASDYDRVTPYTPKPAPTPVPVVESQKGYFGQPTQADRGYFKNFFTARDSEARFSAEEKNNVANFEPLLNSRAEVETLLHTDAAKLAVDFTGCSPQEATRATVVKPGVAKFEGNRWYIIQKALVAINS